MSADFLALFFLCAIVKSSTNQCEKIMTEYAVQLQNRFGDWYEHITMFDFESALKEAKFQFDQCFWVRDYRIVEIV